MIWRRLTCLLSTAAVALLMLGCETTKVQPGDETAPSPVEILFKRPTGSQFGVKSQIDMGHGGLQVIGRATDDESGIKSIKLEFTAPIAKQCVYFGDVGDQSGNLGSVTYHSDAGYPVSLPPPVQDQPGLNAQGEAYKMRPLGPVELDRPTCQDPDVPVDPYHPDLMGVPVGLVITVVVTATNNSSNAASSHTTVGKAYVTVIND